MISAISSVSFRGETDNKDLNALINQPGKYSNSAQAAPLAPEADRADLSTKASKEKSNTGKVIGGTLAALALSIMIGPITLIGIIGSCTSACIMITGTFNSSAAPITAIILSRFGVLKDPTAHFLASASCRISDNVTSIL